MGLFGAFVVEPRGSSYLEPLGAGDRHAGHERLADHHQERHRSRLPRIRADLS